MTLEDSQIIALFGERSERAIGELDIKYGAVIRRVAANILSDRRDAEECVSDTYWAVWNSIPPNRPELLMPYVCRIARHTAINRYHAGRAKRRSSRCDAVLEELERCLPARETVESAYDEKELAGAINRFLAGLPQRDRVLFVRRYFYADAVKEIAQSMQMSSGAASLRLHRLRKKLRTYLQKEGMDG